MQIQQTRFGAAACAQIETGVGTVEQVVDRLAAVLDRPVAEQVVIGGEHRAIPRQFFIERGQGRGLHQAPGNVHGVYGVDQRFLDRVVAIARCRRTDGQGLVDPAGGFQCTEHLLEAARLHRVEHAQFRRAQRFLFHGARVFEQRVIAKIVPHRATGAIAHQQTVEVGGGAQGAPVFEGGVDVQKIGHCVGSLKTKGGWTATLSRAGIEPDQHRW